MEDNVRHRDANPDGTTNHIYENSKDGEKKVDPNGNVPGDEGTEGVKLKRQVRYRQVGMFYKQRFLDKYQLSQLSAKKFKKVEFTPMAFDTAFSIIFKDIK